MNLLFETNIAALSGRPPYGAFRVKVPIALKSAATSERLPLRIDVSLAIRLVICLCGLMPFGASSGLVAQDVKVDFAHEIVPILRSHCAECHTGSLANGGFSMNSRELLMESGYVDLAEPAQSYLLELVSSSDPELQMPPKDRPRLQSRENELLARWIDLGLEWEPGFTFAPNRYEPPVRPRVVALPDAIDGRENPIDRIVGRYFADREIVWREPISDAAFLRRVHLDLVGTLPTPADLAAFVEDPSESKRAHKVRALLEDRTAYAEHWLSFFNDLLRNDYSGTGFITGGRKQVTSWLYDALVRNMPFDELAIGLIAPKSSESRGFIDGIRWRGEVSAGQTVEIQFAQSVSQAFLGINLKCASCHDSFIDRWTLADAYGLASIYADNPMELYRCDKPTGRVASANWLFPELGNIDPNADRETRLEQLAALMTHRENGRFARTIVNRLWHRLMGRGIVHPLDAMQTEPWSEDLLDYLGEYLVEHDYDLKAVLELIANSEIYRTRVEVVHDERSDEYVFRGPRARRLTAEQFVDAVWQLTDTAPHQFDADVVRGQANQVDVEGTEVNAAWIWDSAAVPPSGQRLVLSKTFELAADVQLAQAAVTCDNEFEMYVNRRKVAAGNDWTQVTGVSLRNELMKGENSIAIIATNAGSTPNPAGLFFSLRVELADGTTSTIESDASWAVSSKIPSRREGRLGALSKPNHPAVELTALTAWQKTALPQVRRILTLGAQRNLPPVRSSLLKNNTLMRSLGRPHREQIVSMRPDQLTTLEAIDLANEPQFANALAVGARRIMEKAPQDTMSIATYLYRFALSRDPTEIESSAILGMMGDTPTAESVQDLIWSICMLPEFILVR